MTGRIALAFDPSNKGFSYGVIEERPRTRPALPHEIGRLRTAGYDRLATGTFSGGHSAGRREVRRLIDTWKPDVIAVETMGGYLSAERQERQRTSAWNIQDLLDCASWSGSIIAVLPDPDACFRMPANNTPRSRDAWRLHLTGTARAGDRHVIQALNACLIESLPVRGRKKDRTPIYHDNDHKRDAMGLGIVALVHTERRP